jgi:hypothetical protein
LKIEITLPTILHNNTTTVILQPPTNPFIANLPRNEWVFLFTQFFQLDCDCPALKKIALLVVIHTQILVLFHCLCGNILPPTDDAWASGADVPSDHRILACGGNEEIAINAGGCQHLVPFCKGWLTAN